MKKEKITELMGKARTDSVRKMVEHFPESGEALKVINEYSSSLKLSGCKPKDVGMGMLLIGMMELFEENHTENMKVALFIHRITEQCRESMHLASLLIQLADRLTSGGDVDKDDIDAELDKWLKKNT